MYNFRNLIEAEAELAKYVPAVREVTGKDITLERITPLMEALDNPQDKLRVIHVAGTSGKTSTAYYIAALLQGDGRKIGLTVSPHIDVITERVQINLQPLGEQTFCNELAEFMEIIKDVQLRPTYFELLIAFMYWYFVKVGVDYAVVETGFGGLHDGTNVAQSPDKICAITDIGYDHTHILGDTLAKISAQKAGIIHTGNEVFMYRQSGEVTDVFKEQAKAVGAELILLKQDELARQYVVSDLEDLPAYQQRNWLLARKTCEFVANTDEFSISQHTEKESLRIQVPGRMDAWFVHGKTIVMDGAHNEQKMAAFVSSFRQKYPGQKAAILLSLKKGKEHQAVLPLLRPITNKLILTTFAAVQDLPTSSMDVHVLAEAAKARGFDNVQAIPDSHAAYSALLQEPDKLLVVTGSFYLLSLMRKYMMEGR
jgi:dihydrofolate synthase / folylpolyglutamate synthase